MMSKGENKTLRWTCFGCGKTWDIEMPGFPGTTMSNWHSHVADYRIPADEPGHLCDGPIVAVMI